MIPTLYLTRNGLLEPLGQSQVKSYLKGVSQDYQITLITFEKPEDMANIQAMVKAKADCEAHGIDWRPKSFRRSPKLVAPAWSMFEMFWSAYKAARAGDAQLIHARSYLPAAAAWAVNRVTGTPFIFDMRALWPEELITAGRLQRGFIVHKVLTHLEKVCLRDAAAVVSLTNAAVEYLRDQYPTELQRQRIAVIPTCADLQRFKQSDKPPSERVYGCVGTLLSGWFLLDWLAAFFNTVAQKDPEARFEVITRDDAETVRAALDIDGNLCDRLSIFPSASESVHEALQKQSTSVMFFTDGTSKLGSAPTRLGEALGCGVPVVANEGVGDVADIIRQNNIGVIVKDGSEASMALALDELGTLRSDPDLPSRCRKAAEEVFSLEAGTKAYRKLYADILGHPEPPEAAPTAQKTANA
ncbi:glycosyltransferase [Amylibacter sp.]|nr:glycosyltransferase [Amylibacter sp.]